MNLNETTFSDASAMVDMCRDELERGGFYSQANALKGLEIFDATGAEVALLTLQNLPSAGGFADETKRYAVQALQAALRSARMAC